MTQREKMLGAAVAAMVVGLGGLYFVNRTMTSFDDRYAQLAAAEKDFNDKQSKLRRGKAASAKLDDWQKHSLPSDLNIARSQYRVWLYEATRKFGLQVDIKPTAERRQGDLYVQHTFAVTGQADLKPLIQFLYHFYDVGYLHRISSVSAHPVTDKKDWDVAMTIDVLSLNKAPAEKNEEPPPAEPRPARTTDEYLAAIMRRNLFSPANNPPSISSVGTQRIYPDQPVRVSIRASDPDKSDKLTYELVSSQLPDAALDSSTGELRGGAGKLGDEWEVVVRVSDDGYPAKIDEETFRIAVVQPPAPPAKEEPVLRDDPARDARITALVGPVGKLQVWVTVPRGLGDQPQTLHLNSGDPISVGSFVGQVGEVRAREAEFVLKDGRKVVIALEQPLVSTGSSTGRP